MCIHMGQNSKGPKSNTGEILWLIPTTDPLFPPPQPPPHLAQANSVTSKEVYPGILCVLMLAFAAWEIIPKLSGLKQAFVFA